MYNIFIFVTIITSWLKVPIGYGADFNKKIQYRSAILIGLGKTFFPKGLNFYNQLEINLNKNVFLIFNQRGFYQGFLGGVPSVLGIACGYRFSKEFSAFTEFERGLEKADQIDYGSNIFSGFNLKFKKKFSISFVAGHGMISTERKGKIDPIGIGVHLTYDPSRNFHFSFEYEPVPNSFITLLRYNNFFIRNLMISPSIGLRTVKKYSVAFFAINFNLLNENRTNPQQIQTIDIEFYTCINGIDTLKIPENFWRKEKNLKNYIIQLINPPRITVEFNDFHGKLSKEKFNFNKVNKFWCVLEKSNGDLRVILTPKREIADKYANNHSIFLTTSTFKIHKNLQIKCFIPIEDLYRF